jgi:hypothetical protein
MNTLLDIITWAPVLLILAVLWTFFAAIRYITCILRTRRGGQVKDIRRYEDYETLAHADWLATGHEAWKKEQERKR